MLAILYLILICFIIFANVIFLAANMIGGLREPETVIEDIFIRKFMTGTWHDCFLSEVSSFSNFHL